jgi:hypothetical protein
LNSNNFPEREIFVQRIVQHFVLSKQTPIMRMYPKLLANYYQLKETDDRMNSLYLDIKEDLPHVNIVTLNKGLLPKPGKEASGDTYYDSGRDLC